MDLTFTAISGWVGFLATAGVGVITIWQNGRFNNESSNFAVQQQKILNNLENINKQQKDMMLRSRYYDILSTYSERISDFYKVFEKYGYGWANSTFTKMLTQTDSELFEIAEISKWNLVKEALSDFSVFLLQDFLFFEGKSELKELGELYEQKLLDHRDNIYMSRTVGGKAYEEYDFVDQEIQEIYRKLVLQFAQYLLKINVFSLQVLDENTPVDFVLKSFNEMRTKQVSWVESGANNMQQSKI
jgi:uncharacterized protein YqgQ